MIKTMNYKCKNCGHRVASKRATCNNCNTTPGMFSPAHESVPSDYFSSNSDSQDTLAIASAHSFGGFGGGDFGGGGAGDSFDSSDSGSGSDSGGGDGGGGGGD